MNLRTRFAPSPTGYLHVGGIRTALFAWLLARQKGGQFILRIEDTDKSREVQGSIEHIITCLNELRLDYDEGPDKGGPYGPYRQSERLDIYRDWALGLIKSGRAYADPLSPEQLAEYHDQAAKNHQPFLYRNHRPDHPPAWVYAKLPLRFKSEPKDYAWHDMIMGDLSAKADAIDDFVLIKSDGYPTYNFAHIVDDYEMQISHVIRGQEFIASTPNYLNLYEALNIEHPTFATPPPVLGPSGNKKLSKRDGAKDILNYIEEGFLPDALINFMASLGWNDGTTKELFSREELLKTFSIERVGKSGARFDEKRLIWMNGAHIRQLPIEELELRAERFWPPEAAKFDADYRRRVLSLIQERLKYLAELPSLSLYFFVDLPIDPDLINNNAKLSALNHETLKSLLKQTLEQLDSSDFSLSDLNLRLNTLLQLTNQPPAVLFSLIRIATTQAVASPQLADSLELIGKERVLRRITQQIESL